MIHQQIRRDNDTVFHNITGIFSGGIVNDVLDDVKKYIKNNLSSNLRLLDIRLMEDMAEACGNDELSDYEASMILKELNGGKKPKAYKRASNYILTGLWYGYLLVFFVGLTVNNLGNW